MTFKAGYINMPVMSSYRFLIDMAVAQAIFGCRKDLLMRFMTVTAINFCHETHARDIFVTRQTPLFVRHRSGVSIDMTAQTGKPLHPDAVDKFVFVA